MKINSRLRHYCQNATEGNLYRYTTNGKRAFSAGRRLLDAQAPDLRSLFSQRKSASLH